MGACIASNQSKESQKTLTSPTFMTAQMHTEMNKENRMQSYTKLLPSNKDNNNQRQFGQVNNQTGMVKQLSPVNIVESGDDTNMYSSNTDELGVDSNARMLRHVVISKNSLNKSSQFSNNKSIKMRRQMGKISSPSSIIINHQLQTTFQFSNLGEIQTIQSRLQNIDQNMLGKGLTPTDNKLIQLTKIAIKPLSLNTVKFKNGSVYHGQWCKGQREGYGTLYWYDGSRYQGQWHLNCSQGQGKLFYNKYEHYQGQFLRNCRHGYGVYVNKQKLYKGQWKDDNQQGHGIETWGKGQYYDGSWVEGRKDGYGQLHFEDGSFYKGNFCSNEINGHGVYCWKDSRTYEGYWEHNTMCGKGILKWVNGDQYEGYFKNNKMHGYGVFTHADGQVSEGCYENGKKHGLFVEINLQKKAEEVEYLMGRVILKNKKNKQAPSRTDSNTISSYATSI